MVAQVIELLDMQNLNGQEVLTAYHFLDATGALTPDDLATNYQADVIPEFAAFQSSDLFHHNVRVRRVFPTADLALDHAVTPTVPGTVSGTDDMPAFTTFSIKWIIGATVQLAGGSTEHIKRGGKRLPGGRESQFHGDTITDVNTIAFVADYVTALLNMDAAGWDLVVASYELPGATPRRQHTVQRYAPVLGGSPPSPGTMNTRKVLRGRTF